MSFKNKSLQEVQQGSKSFQWTNHREDSRYQDLYKSMGVGKYQLFNEFPRPDHKSNWVSTETDLKNLHCPDSYFANYNKCLDKVDMNKTMPYHFVDQYYSAQDHTLLTDDNKRLKGPVHPRQDYVVLKYQNKINPNHFAKQSVLNFKDKYQNQYKQKLQQKHSVVADPGWKQDRVTKPIVQDKYRWTENGITYGYSYNVRD